MTGLIMKRNFPIHKNTNLFSHKTKQLQSCETVSLSCLIFIMWRNEYMQHSPVQERVTLAVVFSHTAAVE